MRDILNMAGQNLNDLGRLCSRIAGASCHERLAGNPAGMGLILQALDSLERDRKGTESRRGVERSMVSEAGLLIAPQSEPPAITLQSEPPAFALHIALQSHEHLLAINSVEAVAGRLVAPLSGQRLRLASHAALIGCKAILQNQSYSSKYVPKKIARMRPNSEAECSRQKAQRRAVGCWRHGQFGSSDCVHSGSASYWILCESFYWTCLDNDRDKNRTHNHNHVSSRPNHHHHHHQYHRHCSLKAFDICGYRMLRKKNEFSPWPPSFYSLTEPRSQAGVDVVAAMVRTSAGWWAPGHRKVGTFQW